MQSTKIIDIKRSFIPVEANAFPENYLTTQSEDKPEESPKVVPYMGHNFLPTSYGYKSFFGTNAKLGVDALAAQAEHIFLFQNLAYSNTLVALTDTGIWGKDANSAGAWTHLVTLAGPADGVYYEWFFTIIKNKLYVFRGNDDHFYEIETDITEALGIIVNEMTPTFMTANAQLGMFRMGGRLGFWDGTNAISWSAPDDLEDFTPSALTGANVTTFNAVIGKISNIRPHGKNAIVYSSKSIVFLQIEPSETFLVKAVPLIEVGVPYARQSIATSDTSIHFCFGTTGIYKIDNGKAEVIVPEIFDYFKGYTQQPVYLRLLNGRYLAFEVLDPDAVNGQPHFYNVSIPAGTVTFPGATSMEQYFEMDISDVDFCDVMAQISSGDMDETQSQASAQLPDQKPGTKAEPIYTCYLSNKGVKDPGNITFDGTPCQAVSHTGTVWPMSPDTDGMKLGSMTTDSSNKTAKTGEESWTDGKWTMERFVATQNAIWKLEEDALDAVLAKILEQAYSETTTTPNFNACVVSNPAYSLCDLGEFVSRFSDHKFGYNTCSFWLTRYVLETKLISAKSRTTVACDTTVPVESPIMPIGYKRYASSSSSYMDSTLYGSPEEIISVHYPGAGQIAQYHPGSGIGFDTAFTGNSNGWCTVYPGGGAIGDVEIKAIYEVPDTTHLQFGTAVPSPAEGSTPPKANLVYQAGFTTKIQFSSAINEVQDTHTGVLGVETAYCEITGWRYTKNDGTTATVASLSCTDTSNKVPGSTPFTGPGRGTNPDDEQPPIIGGDGVVCNMPFLAPITPEEIYWPDQTIGFPESSFLFQDGSIAPRWPTIYGAFVYDLHLKKWGKYTGEYKQLLDYLPINSDSAVPVSGTNPGMLAGVLKENGFIYLFDKFPASSEITWGKIGYYRQGNTDLHTVDVKFANSSRGKIAVDLSWDGKTINTAAHYEQDFDSVVQKIVYPPYSGKWYNLTVSGYYDISDITITASLKGRR